MRQNFHSLLVFAVALLALFGGVQRGPAQEVAPVPKLLIYTPPVIAVGSQKSMTVRDLRLCLAATEYTWKSDETLACPSNNPLDCGNGWCCPESYTMHCPHSTCDDITDGKDGCYNPDRLTDEQLAHLKNCCPALASCS